MRALRLAAAMIVAIAASGPVRPIAAADTNVTITIPSIEVADSPYFVAQEKGYFAAEGLHVDFTSPAAASQRRRSSPEAFRVVLRARLR